MATQAWLRPMFSLPQGSLPTSSRSQNIKPEATATDTEVISLDDDSRMLKPLLHMICRLKISAFNMWDCYVPGHLAYIFFSFLPDMYLYDHMTSTHMTAYLYNRAILSGTPLFPLFVRSPLFSSYGSL